MNELLLYKFIRENNIEFHWYEDEIIIFIRASQLSDFFTLCKKLGINYDDGGWSCRLQENCIALDIAPILETLDFDEEAINEIFPKD